MANNLKLRLLKKANESFRDSLEKCLICPRRCGVNRKKGKIGYCRAPASPVVYSYGPHHGEEPPLSGSRGSGTIFFSHCNMKCAYCQNYCFSQLDAGKEVSIERLSEIMLSLQDAGCHNINLVGPTHFAVQILLALEKAIAGGLGVPIVYNTGGYDLAGIVKALEGIVDIYMPDMRYSDNAMAGKYSDAPDYVEVNRAAVQEMQRQVGDLVVDDGGIAERGLIIRLLVLPENISGTNDTLQFIKGGIGPNSYLSIMNQYRPTFKAYNYTDISRRPTVTEYKNVVDCAKLLGLNNGWVQEGRVKNDHKFFGTKIPPKY